MVRCFWLDELEHSDAVHPRCPLLFRTPQEALDALGTNCAIVRILRRTFVVVRGNDTLWTIEVPGLCAALVVWLGYSADVPLVGQVPAPLRHLVISLRRR